MVVVRFVEVYHKRIHIIVGIVDAEVDGTLHPRMTFELLMEVDTEVEAMVGFKAVVVTVVKVAYSARIATGRMGLPLIVVGVEGAAG